MLNRGACPFASPSRQRKKRSLIHIGHIRYLQLTLNSSHHQREAYKDNILRTSSPPIPAHTLTQGKKFDFLSD